MKSLTIILSAVSLATLQTEIADAFTPLRFSSRAGTANPSAPSSSPFFPKTVSDPLLIIMRSSAFERAVPNNQVVQEEYARWRLKFNKGEFNPVRYENFKTNFMAVTVRNNMERTRALQNGEPAPSPIALNEYGDCSADEYRMAMSQPQSNRSSNPRRMPSTNSTPARVNNQGLQPSNTIINNSSSNNKNSGMLSEGLTNANSQLRAAVQQRTSLESELLQMKKMLDEKKKLLANATKDEQTCQERLNLREEQKRLLNDRLTNGWEDERGSNNNYY
uniref:Cathepsin propeptide inhibitor domain-containing protein n=1 Tax=Pseudo-nitzschia australis TaxID=44445 RepID=A0A7S4EG59_9STRA|mmetsp:Transcript_6628/g.14116  ORF Transcript_6628/g.14116 Transcript_6628/m.14116 type:complete len:276 (-) Transcript_6628:510-1337(-)